MGSRKRPRQAGGFNKAYDQTGRQVHSEFAAGGESRENLLIIAVVDDGVGAVVVDVVVAIMSLFRCHTSCQNRVAVLKSLARI